jgi:hypothetical protein
MDEEISFRAESTKYHCFRFRHWKPRQLPIRSNQPWDTEEAEELTKVNSGAAGEADLGGVAGVAVIGAVQTGAEVLELPDNTGVSGQSAQAILKFEAVLAGSAAS